MSNKLPLKTRLRRALPSYLRGTSIIIKDDVRGIIRSALSKGSRFHCPCCGASHRKLRRFRDRKVPFICPRCGSFPRTRLMWLYLERKTSVFTEPVRLLHMAPPILLMKKFADKSNIHYVTADLYAEHVGVKTDITDLLFRDGFFDVILCNHVLEHIPDDSKAMMELLRVLKPGGWAMVMIPVDLSLEKTYEDPNITSEADRLKHFGQEDHVRQYGRDYVDRLKSAGFEVEISEFIKELSDEETSKFCVSDEDVLYIVHKPN